MATTADLMGLGLPAALASKLGNVVTNPLVGVGTTQTGAALLPSSIVYLTPTAGAAAYILGGTSSQSRLFFLVNSSAAVTALVFPPISGLFNGGVANAAISIPPNTAAIIQLISGGGVVPGLWSAIIGQSAASQALLATQYTAIATNTPATLTGAQMAGASDVTINMTATLGGAGTLNSATAVQIVAAIPYAQPGFSYNLRIINSSGANFAWTLTTATGITLNGTMTIAQNTFRDFYVTVTSLTAVAIQSIGTGTNS
jgi:hypothetical protein